MSRCWGQPPQLQKEQFWGLLPGSPVLLKPSLLFSVLLPVSMFIFPPPLLFLCLSFFSAPQCCFFLHFTVLFPVPFCSCSSVLLPHLTFLFMTCFPIPLCSSLPPSFSLVGRSLPLSLSAHTYTLFSHPLCLYPCFCVFTTLVLLDTLLFPILALCPVPRHSPLLPAHPRTTFLSCSLFFLFSVALSCSLPLFCVIPLGRTAHSSFILHPAPCPSVSLPLSLLLLSLSLSCSLLFSSRCSSLIFLA